MNKILFVYDDHSPLKNSILNCSVESIHADQYKNQQAQVIYDFTTYEREEKKKLLKSLQSQNIISELTCLPLEEFYSEFKNLKACFSSLFVTSKRKIEIHFKEQVDTTDAFSRLELFPVEVKTKGIGFIYPRTFAQIVNEAYFALEESVASKEDIDRAMKFGVNYPFGPFEWSEGKEKFIIRILTELQKTDSSNRYHISPLLIKEAQ